MACERALDALADVAAGAAASREIEAHLASCAACRARLAELRQALARVDGELAGLLQAEPSPALLPRIRAAVEADAPGWRPSWRGSPAWLAVAATLLTGLALVVFLAGRPEVSGRRVAGTQPAPSAAGSASVQPRPAGPGPATSADVPAPTASESAVGTPSRRAVSAGRPGDGPPPRRAERQAVEVVVPADEATALLRLAEVVAQGRLDATAVMAALSGTSGLLAEPAPIEISPLEIAPLEPSGSAGT